MTKYALISPNLEKLFNYHKQKYKIPLELILFYYSILI